MAMINYADKVALNSNSVIADINKCNATDMNELKSAFNNQVAFGWYQTGISPTFTFVSYDSTTYTGVVNSNLDLTSYLSVGMKVKFTQNSAVKYAFITAITSTQLTLFLGTDYSLNNSAISNTYYSMLKAPFGFPLNADKWTNKMVISTNSQTKNPTADTWYLKGTLSVGTGVWDIGYDTHFYAYNSTSTTIRVQTTLSTTTNSVSDSEFTSKSELTTIGYGNDLSKRKIVKVDIKTDFNLLYKAEYQTYSQLTLDTSIGAVPTVIKAVCAYL